MPDPVTIIQGISGLKTMLDGFRTAIALVRDVKDLKVTEPSSAKAIDDALASAEQGATIAAAEVAKALGYELCKCSFPPTIMLTVGQREIYGKGPQAIVPVYECPKCGFNNAGGWAYNRSAPPRPKPSDGAGT